MTKELIPCFLDTLTVSLDQCQQLAQMSRIEAAIVGEMRLWPKPEFGLSIALLDMNMGWLSRVALVGVKEKSKAANSEGSWHNSQIPSRLAACFDDDTTGRPGITAMPPRSGAMCFADGHRCLGKG